MDALVEILLEYGYAGMFIAAFLSGSVVPFSSELVMAGLIQLGLNPVFTILVGTLGNSLGSMTCYWVGKLGNMHWIERIFHVKPKQLKRAERYAHEHGAWVAILCFLPALGEAIAIVLGMMRSNGWLVFLYMTIGKLLRYAVLIYASELIF
jgi:membrane protein YqaA with SNARE-associated domain